MAHPRNARKDRIARLEVSSEDFVGKMRLAGAVEDECHGRWLLKGDHSWVEVVTLCNGVYVGGDIETVVFQTGSLPVSPRSRVAWMATRSYAYAAEKARRGDTGDDEWDESCARADLLWNRRQRYIEKGAARNLWEILKGDCEHHEFLEAIYDETDDCEMCDMGVVVSKSVVLATAALRHLKQLLDKA